MYCVKYFSVGILPDQVWYNVFIWPKIELFFPNSSSRCDLFSIGNIFVV